MGPEYIRQFYDSTDEMPGRHFGTRGLCVNV